MAQVFGRGVAGAWRRLRRAGAGPSAVAEVFRAAEVEPAAQVEPEPAPERPRVASRAPQPVLVDSSTRTWWKPGAAGSETLVETVAPRATSVAITRRVAAMAATRISAGSFRADRVPGTADPAFTELLLLELLRAGSWDRAFSLLAPECQEAWRSPSALADAHAGMARRIAGARVAAVRALDSWEDEGRSWKGVAELVVEYALQTPDGLRPLRRTVHLVDAGGRWRSLLFPPGERRASPRDTATRDAAAGAGPRGRS